MTVRTKDQAFLAAGALGAVALAAAVLPGAVASGTESTDDHRVAGSSACT